MDQETLPPEENPEMSRAEETAVASIVAASDEREARLLLMKISARIESQIKAEAASKASADDAAPAAEAASLTDARDDTHLTATYCERPSVIIVMLDAPFEWEGRSIAEIPLREPALGDVEAVVKGHLSQLDLFERMSGVPAPAFKAMRWTDSERVVMCARALAPEMRKV